MRRFAISLAICAILFFSFAALARQANPPGDVVIGSGSFSPIVKDLDQSLAFYRALLGVTAPAPATPTAFGADPVLLNFLGTPKAQVRVGTVRIPGTAMNVEIIDFKDIERKPIQPRLQDPGAVMLILLVRDVDTLFGSLKKDGVRVVTNGGTPVNIDDKNRAVVIQDPDGFHTELLQMNPLPETTAPANSNVIGARFALTVSDTNQTMRVYRDTLGFKPEVGEFATSKAWNDLMNTPGAQIRRSSAQVPGSPLRMEFLEFKNIDRKPLGAHIQDPGATRLQLRVRDADTAVKALIAAGGEVITTGGNGGPIDMRGLHLAIVREINNLFLVIFAQGQHQ
jgi:catechol 2,3-dioxygenase-like lactoylglutathione lyase family enzyme